MNYKDRFRAKMNALRFSLPEDIYVSSYVGEDIYKSAQAGTCKHLDMAPDPLYWLDFIDPDGVRYIVSLRPNVVYRIIFLNRYTTIYSYMFALTVPDRRLMISIMSLDSLDDLSHIDACDITLRYPFDRIPKLPFWLNKLTVSSRFVKNIERVNCSALIIEDNELQSIKYPLVEKIICNEIVINETPRIFSLESICKHKLGTGNMLCDFCHCYGEVIERVQNTVLGIPVKTSACIQCQYRHANSLLIEYERFGNTIYKNTKKLHVRIGSGEQKIYMCHGSCKLWDKLFRILTSGNIKMSTADAKRILENNGILDNVLIMHSPRLIQLST